VNEKLTDFRQLNVWQKAHALVLSCYEITKRFPKDERTDLTSRLRNAAVNIPVRIADGFLLRSPREKKAAYSAAQMALEEVKYLLILAGDLEYIRETMEILEPVEEVGRMLAGLVRSVRESKTDRG